MSDKNYNLNDEFDPTIAHLARHMQALRETVPVNYELKHALKKRLLEQMQKKTGLESKKSKGLRKKRIYGFLSLLCILAVVLIATFLTDSKLRVLEVTELGTYSAQGIHSEHPITVSPDGGHAVMEYNGTLLLLAKDGRTKTVMEGEYSGIFQSPSWSNQKEWFAVVYEQEDRSEIWLIQQTRQLVSRLIYAEEGATFSSLQWSEDDQWVIVSKKQTDLAGDGESVQVRTDASEVQKNTMIVEESNTLHQTEELAEVQWTNSLKKKIDTADEFWFDWNRDHNALALLIRHNENVEVFLLKLKNKKVLPKQRQ